MTQILHVAERLTAFLLQHRAELLSEVIELLERAHTGALVPLEQVMDALEAQVPPLLDLLAAQPMQQTDYRSLLLQAYQLLSDATDQSAQGADRTSACDLLQNQTRELSDAVRHFIGREAHELPEVSAVSAREVAASPRPPQEPQEVAPPRAGPFPLLSVVSAAITRCRQARGPLSLMLAELDGPGAEPPESANLKEAADQRMLMLCQALRAAIGSDGSLLTLSPCRLAILLEGYDRQQGVELARQLQRGLNYWSLERGHSSLALSIGLATVSLPVEELPAPGPRGSGRTLSAGCTVLGGRRGQEHRHLLNLRSCVEITDRFG